MSDYIEFDITVDSEILKDLLIVELSEIGFEGFEEDTNLLKAFIPVRDFKQSRFNQLAEEHALEYARTIIKQKNWNEFWEAGYDPVIVHDFCAVRAEFHRPVPNVRHEIIITPKMSFGTGHHATTFMMIKAMEHLELQDNTVLDFGTGTGVLAILAEKSGAASVVAIDYDDWSINNAKENILLNNCTKVNIEKADHISTGNTFDVILANINKNIILDHFVSIEQHLSPGGKLLLSGLLENDQDDILKAAEGLRLKFNEKSDQNGWICLLLVKES
jgi:ribosomal protein L11 methyltransferase